MDVIVVEPSPLIRNVCRLLLQQQRADAPMVSLAQLADLTRLDRADVPHPFLVIGGSALLSEYGVRDWRPILLEHPEWRSVPKLVLYLERDSAALAAMRDLPRTHWLKRPFRPEQFLSLLSAKN